MKTHRWYSRKTREILQLKSITSYLIWGESGCDVTGICQPDNPAAAAASSTVSNAGFLMSLHSRARAHTDRKAQQSEGQTSHFVGLTSNHFTPFLSLLVWGCDQRKTKHADNSEMIHKRGSLAVVWTSSLTAHQQGEEPKRFERI